MPPDIRLDDGMVRDMLRRETGHWPPRKFKSANRRTGYYAAPGLAWFGTVMGVLVILGVCAIVIAVMAAVLQLA